MSDIASIGVGAIAGAAGNFLGANKLRGGAETAQASYEAQARAAQAEIEKSYGQGRDDLNSGFTEGLGYIQPYLAGNQSAYDSYLNSLGLNGQDAYNKSVDQFQQGPGYEFSMNQGLRSLDRSAAARGLNKSGAAIKGALGFSQGLANQEFGKYQDRLLGLGTQGQALANDVSNRRNTLGQNLGDLSKWRGSQQSGILTGLGTVNAETDMARANAQAAQARAPWDAIQNTANGALAQKNLAKK